MKKVLFLFIFSFLLTGCTGHGPEEQLMVVSLGIDTGKDGIEITVKMPGFSGQDTSDHNGERNYFSMTAGGKDIQEAFVSLKTLAPRVLNFSQLRQILLSDRLTMPLSRILYFLSHIDGIRSQALLAICRGSAGELIQSQKASIGTRLSRFIDTTLETAIRQGNIPYSTLICALNSVHDEDQDLLLARIQKREREKNKEKSLSGGLKNQDVDSFSPDDILYIGSFCLDGSKLSGQLTGRETSLCRFLLRHTRQITLSTSQGFVTLSPRTGPYFHIDETEGTVLLKLKANFNLHPQFGAQINLAAAEKEITEEIVNLIRKLQLFRCDALGFGGIYVRNYKFISDWENSNWKNIYQNSALEADLSFTLMDES